MGLGGRREKQIITADPRNTRWLNDTSSPGHRLLAGMGYDPAIANSSEKKTGLYGHESSKRLKQIPIAKGGMEGIGFKPAGSGANVALGALPTRMAAPGSLASAASSIFSKLGSRAALQFVTAGASKEVINRSKTEGGEFGGLLARLNAAAASASATPEPEATEVVEVVVQETSEGDTPVNEEDEDEDERRRRKKQRKLEKAAEKAEKKERKLAKKLAKASKEQSNDSATDSAASPSVTTPSELPVDAPSANALRMQHWNASRSRNLRAKRMLHASADAMAEILGIAPTPSPSASGYSTPASLPATIAPPTLPSTSVTVEAATRVSQEPTGTATDDAAKLKRKAEKKAAKALEASKKEGNAPESETDTGKELKKKKRKRDT
ncbi:hypothetical protein P389DRAFT_168293 [Cystobasidium minutum MCA 4210]|uniref:uncharacterized protein n=1 Tax=Cystobasidium minutum MCA 4210 TaxID=1397322 RepID=UPI0034CEF8C2|eukprot:jgi/Rhomi1/168293/fgenesh1_kg.2_\